MIWIGQSGAFGDLFHTQIGIRQQGPRRRAAQFQQVLRRRQSGNLAHPLPEQTVTHGMFSGQSFEVDFLGVV